ncbi:PqqD family protein, partial [Gemmatimonadota bacterium]
KRDIPWRIIEGEAIVVEVDRGEIIHLNETGAEIWNVLDGQKTVSDIITHIRNEFEVTEEVAERDTGEFLGQLIDLGLLE